MFGRRRSRGQQTPPEPESEEIPQDAAGQPPAGPYDGAQPPDDGHNRLDLGSVRLPVPEGAQLKVEVDRDGPVRAVHLMTPLGQLTVTAFAAPRSGGLWDEVRRELRAQLRNDGARVSEADGEWGREIIAVTSQATLRFLAVDGPRWMLRGVAAGTGEQAGPLTELLRDVVRGTVVVRGPEPLPVRSPLPLELPPPLAEQLKQAAQEQRQTAQDSKGSTGQA